MDQGSLHGRYMRSSASASVGEGYFALVVERRLWRALRSFPRRPLQARFPPIAGAGGAFGARASLLDVGWMRDALSSDTVTRRVPSIESRGPASPSRL